MIDHLPSTLTNKLDFYQMMRNTLESHSDFQAFKYKEDAEGNKPEELHNRTVKQQETHKHRITTKYIVNPLSKENLLDKVVASNKYGKLNVFFSPIKIFAHQEEIFSNISNIIIKYQQQLNLKPLKKKIEKQIYIDLLNPPPNLVNTLGEFYRFISSNKVEKPLLSLLVQALNVEFEKNLNKEDAESLKLAITLYDLEPDDLTKCIHNLHTYCVKMLRTIPATELNTDLIDCVIDKAKSVKDSSEWLPYLYGCKSQILLAQGRFNDALKYSDLALVEAFDKASRKQALYNKVYCLLQFDDKQEELIQFSKEISKESGETALKDIISYAICQKFSQNILNSIYLAFIHPELFSEENINKLYEEISNNIERIAAELKKITTEKYKELAKKKLAYVLTVIKNSDKASTKIEDSISKILDVKQTDLPAKSTILDLAVLVYNTSSYIVNKGLTAWYYEQTPYNIMQKVSNMLQDFLLKNQHDKAFDYLEEMYKDDVATFFRTKFHTIFCSLLHCVI